MPEEKKDVTRREFLHRGVRGAVLLGISGSLGLLALDAGEDLVWQIDPEKCIACGNCATRCVLTPSAVKATRAFAMCGYCDLCLAYFEPQPSALNTGAENQMCPTGALKRAFVEDPYYTYTVDEDLCIGCAKCVKGCTAFGNGSTFLQVRHDRCLNCHQCSIAAECPSGAFRRVPASQPYLLKDKDTKG
jgi:electron transport complex protein RnfB